MILFIVHLLLEIKITSTTGVTSVLSKSLFVKYLYNHTAIVNVTDLTDMENSMEALLYLLYTDTVFDPDSIEIVYNEPT